MVSQDLTLREVYLADMYEDQIRRKDAQIRKLERAISEHLENVYLIDIVAKIRDKAGVGEKPMLADLPEAIGARIRELEEAPRKKRRLMP